MKKVLITGSTSSQYSVAANNRNIRFSGLLSEALHHYGVHGQLKEPCITKEELSSYDTVVVGISPFSSLSANKIYEAFHVLNMASTHDNVFVMLDAPEPHLVFDSLRAILANSSNLTKSIYSKRSGYSRFMSDPEFRESVEAGIQKLNDAEFKVVVPSVPYRRHSVSSLKIKGQSLVELNFDSKFSNDELYRGTSEKFSYWIADNPTNKWVSDVSKTVDNPVIKVKRNNYDDDMSLLERVSNACGYLAPIYRHDNPWWSRNIMLALSAGTPVVSDWRHTSVLGSGWSRLAFQLESLSEIEKVELAKEQKASYLSLCPTWNEICEYTAEKLVK